MHTLRSAPSDQHVEAVISGQANVPERHFRYLQGSHPIGHYGAEFDELREECPGLRSTADNGYWVVTRMDELREIFNSPETFSNHGLSLVAPNPAEPVIPMQLDPPEHTKWRKPLMAEFSLARARALDPVMREHANALIDEMLDTGSCDFVTDFAQLLPIAVFLTMLNLPQSELPRFLAWENAIVRPVDLEAVETYVAGEKARLEIAEYFSELLDRRTAEPGDDLVTRALNWRVDDRAPSREELLNIFLTLFVAGLDTISSELSYSFWHFATHPDDRRRIVEEPALVPKAVEELLRFYDIILDGREVTADTELAGCPMQRGDLVLLLSGAANRDPRAFDRADEVVLDRSPNPHLTFGWGIHRCVGQHLARQEMRVAFEEWHRRIPDYQIKAGSDIRERPFLQLNMESLPLTWPASH